MFTCITIKTKRTNQDDKVYIAYTRKRIRKWTKRMQKWWAKQTRGHYSCNRLAGQNNNMHTLIMFPPSQQ